MPLNVALIGQSAFGAAVYEELKKKHTIVGVFTILDNAKTGREDAIATAAKADNVPVFKLKTWRVKGKIIPEVFEQYKSVNADVNVMAFVSQFIPMEVINHPPKGSICYHPSILPKHRGASAINWTIMMGDAKGGFTIFWPDDGLDTGEILLIRETELLINDTLNSFYNRFLFPEGVKAMAEAVDLIEAGKAPKIKQDESLATYDKIWKKKELAEIKWATFKDTLTVHNFIRGNDKIPGAWTTLDGEKVTLYSSSLLSDVIAYDESKHTQVVIDGYDKPALQNAHPDGLVFTGNDGKQLLIEVLKFESGKITKANQFGKASDNNEKLELTADEQKIADIIKEIWTSILGCEVEDSTDFFGSGAGSMDVMRLTETIQKRCDITLDAEKVFMNTEFAAFINLSINYLRNGGEEQKQDVKCVEVEANDMTLKFPNQLFINGLFVDAKDSQSRPTINPTTEETICDVAYASVDDVNKAVQAAKDAFEAPAWRRMNARDRGKLLWKLADLMEEHKEELSTLESIDSGAVYTLALKTHVGMSIDTFRYYAGWCDKIEGTTIPVNNAKPNYNLCITKREPVGVCAIVIPWNYPLMMLSWKMGACLAAGNTVVIKPASVTPLTALKWAQLVQMAGFPDGVINVLTGSGTVVGHALATHPDVRKIGFTGSTGVGKTIMESCAKSNLKKVSLELGGKSPLIIFDDCDFDKAVRNALSSSFFNKGENCIAAGRIFVQDTLHDKFLAAIVEETKKMKIGDPLDRSTSHGPQNHEAHLKKLLAFIESGKAEGAKLVYGGKRLDRKGYFLEPTIFTNVTDDMFIAQEESFGPILIILPFKEVDEVIKRANNSEFALASGVFTRDINKALLVSEKLDAGTVFVNTYNKTDVAAPFGGFKQSGFGKDLGKEALHEYTKVKTITIEYA